MKPTKRQKAALSKLMTRYRRRIVNDANIASLRIEMRAILKR